MNLRQLEIFHAVMKCGSVTRASQMLNVSQPAVSHAIRHYEDQLGKKLFERKGGRLVPTREALRIFPDVQHIFRRIEALERSMAQSKGGRAEPISIATTPAIAGRELALAVAAYMKKYPGATVEIQSLKSPEVIELVSRHEVDFGIGHAPNPDVSLETEHLTEQDVQCVLPNNHPLAKQSEISVLDLHEVPIISYSRHAVLSAPIHKAFAALGATPRIRVQTNDAFLAFMMANAGLGVAVVPPSHEVAQLFPDLKVVPLHPRVANTISLLWSSGKPLSRHALELIEMLKATFAAPAPATSRTKERSSQSPKA